jgi:hypothetical protein
MYDIMCYVSPPLTVVIQDSGNSPVFMCRFSLFEVKVKLPLVFIKHHREVTSTLDRGE